MKNMSLTEKQLASLIKSIKHYKTDFLIFNGNIIYFMNIKDNTFVMNIVLKFDTCIRGIYYYNMILDFLTKDFNIDYNGDIYNSDNKCINNVCNLFYMKIPEYVTNPINDFMELVYDDSNIRNNEIFENYISLNYPNILYIKGIYPLTLFKGLLPINKPDKVSLKLYRTDYEQYIAYFNIIKTDYIVNKYIKYINI